MYVMLTLLFTSRTWVDPSNDWIGHCCDQQQFMWFLAWSPTAIELGQNPLLTDHLNAPAGANLMWNGSSPLVTLALAPVTRLLGPVFAYNVAALAGIALSGLACFVALRRDASGPLGPLVGGALYAFSPYVASHTALHLNLIHAWGPPLFLMILDELVVRRRYRPELLGVALGVVGVAQLVTFEEVLATSAIAGALLVLVLAAVVRERTAILDSTRRLLRAALPGLAAFLLLGGFPLAVQFMGPQQIHGRVQDPETFSTDLLNVVLPTPYQLIAPDVATAISDRFSGLFHEATAYIGVPLLLVLGWIIWDRRRDPRIIVAATMGLLLLILSLGPRLFVGTEPTSVPLPWLPLAGLPLLEHALPGRLTLFMWLAIAVIVAIAVDHAMGLARRPAALRLAAVGVALLFVVPTPAASSTAPVPKFFADWDQANIGDDEIILFAPWFTNGAGADPMLWAAFAEARPRMYEGYVYVPRPDGLPRYGPTPGGLAKLMIRVQDRGERITLSDQDRGAARRELSDAGISVVIVGQLRYRSEMVALFTDLFGRPPEERDGVQIWRDVQAAVGAG